MSVHPQTKNEDFLKCCSFELNISEPEAKQSTRVGQCAYK